MRDRPAGTIRITATDHAADTVIWPKLAPVLKHYPDINVEVVTDYALTDVVAEKCGGQVISDTAMGGSAAICRS
ncbi:HTH-type transcriptional regulator PgrR [wastewater metagenome]|uniref:HTH-type transcriptional regulator PgrR n=2 Tax=unclassified sequences TaxID=12908 RepID=A0A5B8RL35_9ZZZZ|nr:HTH-type transcriptional regulator PgrR [uncultured organism]